MLSFVGREGQPCNQSSDLLVLTPWRADRPAHFCEAEPQIVERKAKVGRTTGGEIFLFYSHDRQAAAFAGMVKCAAKKLTFCCMEQGVRGERCRERRGGAARAEGDAAADNLIAHLSQTADHCVHSLFRQEPCPVGKMLHVNFGLLNIQFLRGMIRLHGPRNFRVRKLNAATINNFR